MILPIRLLNLAFVLSLSMFQVSAQQVCDVDVAFNDTPLAKKQTLNLDETTTLTMHQFLTTHVTSSAKVATNVTCQQLSGANYTGSKEEWAGVIKSALDGINAKGATNVEFIITNDQNRVYSSLGNNKEYDFRANFGGNKQVIKNFTYLDLPRNTVYTLSVSGAEQVEDEVVKEFTRLVNSFKLN